MKKIIATDGKMLLWEERKIVSDSIYAPDDTDFGTVREITQEEAEEYIKSFEEENKEANEEANEEAEK